MKKNEWMYGVVFKVKREHRMEELQSNLRAMKEAGFD